MIREFYTAFHPTVEKGARRASRPQRPERILGTDPKSGKQVSARIGRYGPIVQIGSADDEEKPRYASMKKDQLIATITLDEALALFELPRTLGELDGKEVVVSIGRYGPYIRYDGKIHLAAQKGRPLPVTLERAVELIHEKRVPPRHRKEPIKVFDAEPEIKVLNGRYGPYIASGGKTTASRKIPTRQRSRWNRSGTSWRNPKIKVRNRKRTRYDREAVPGRYSLSHNGTPRPRRCQLMPAQVIRHTGPRRTHRILAFGPVGGTNFAVLFEVLECIDHADDFIDTAPQWQVVDDHMPYDTAPCR